MSLSPWMMLVPSLIQPRLFAYLVLPPNATRTSISAFSLHCVHSAQCSFGVRCPPCTCWAFHKCRLHNSGVLTCGHALCMRCRLRVRSIAVLTAAPSEFGLCSLRRLQRSIRAAAQRGASRARHAAGGAGRASGPGEGARGAGSSAAAWAGVLILKTMNMSAW